MRDATHKAWRERAGYSQRQLAKRAGLALSTVNERETGKRAPNWTTLRKLAGAYLIAPGARRLPPGTPAAEAAEVRAAVKVLHGVARATTRPAELARIRLCHD